MRSPKPRNPLEKQKLSWNSILTTVLLVVIAVVCVFTIVFNVIFMRFDVQGISMQPTLNPTALTEDSPLEDKAYVNRFDKGTRGDIVVLFNPNAPDPQTGAYGIDIIKRIIAVGGDKINIESVPNSETGLNDYYVFLGINGGPPQQLNENYILTAGAPVPTNGNNNNANGMYTSYLNFIKLRAAGGEGFSVQPDGSLLIAPGYVFVMGDNRAHSDDSTHYGPFKVSSIVGAVSFWVPYNENFWAYWWNRIF